MRMTQESAHGRFARARVARLATVSARGEPHLVPVTFAVIARPVDGTAMIVFAIDHKAKTTVALRRLDNIAANPQVAFLADSYSEDWEQLWWVRADADAGILAGELRQRALTALATKYVQYEQNPPDGVVVGAAVSRWTGWQATAAQPMPDR